MSNLSRSSVAWRFWVDVGGTFTDCIGLHTSGRRVRHKVLSSAVTKGTVAEGSSAHLILDPDRSRDPTDFWRGSQLRLLSLPSAGNESASHGRASQGGEGEPVEEIPIAASRSFRLELARPLRHAPRPGQRYEILFPEESPLLAIRQMLEIPRPQPLPELELRLGTTRGTNALLTRRGARVALVTTRGFHDILEIGYQDRPRLFDLDIRKPEPLYERVIEIDERVTPSGEVLLPLRELLVREQLQAVRDLGIESLAICLLHAYCQPAHELTVARLAREVGFDEISISSRAAPFIKLVARGDTTVLDAYLNPVLRSYVRRLEDALQVGAPAGPARPHSLRLLTSAGGLVEPEKFTGKDSILSGPAGGVVGYARVAEAAGARLAIGFDMGGTSTDVSRYDGRFEYEYESRKAGVRVLAPSLAIETVAAGGGSICNFDGVALRVGPDSAGADPGPACYGRGGPLTITDINLFLGRLHPEHFPFRLDEQAVQLRLETVAREVTQATGRPTTAVELADGFRRIANSNMARAIHRISVAKGYDPRDYLLVAFGGAGPQHACAVADELHIRQVLIHPDASLLSAYGIGLADQRCQRATGLYRKLDATTFELLPKIFAKLEAAAIEELDSQPLKAADSDKMAVSALELGKSFQLELRYVGTEASFPISWNARTTIASLASAFEREHRRLYGYIQVGRELEAVAARVEVVRPSPLHLPLSESLGPVSAAPPENLAAAERAVSPDATNSFSTYLRSDLAAGARRLGPALIVDEHTTTVVETGWEAEVLSQGELKLARTAVAATTSASSNAASPAMDAEQLVADPVLVEIFHNQFAGIAERMGVTLRNTASSVNVKERLDFSCAIFTARGDLVVNAPHIPVHLGAMAETVRQIARDNPQMRPGDVFVTNDPYRGGSHLPDITVVTPIHDRDSGRLVFFTASRAHHAEIGGITPGSMPPFSTNLAEEGILIRNFRLIEGRSAPRADGTWDTVEHLAAFRELLRSGPYPSRAPETNIADVLAQVAANQMGADGLHALVEQRGLPLVETYMRFIQDSAERKMRRALGQLPAGEYALTDQLDDGSPIAVRIQVRDGAARIDFNGTGPVVAGNLNANRAIVTAAVLYCLRCLIGEEIPLNQGVLAPVELNLPECLLNPSEGATPESTPAIAGGNVETSQRLVDVILGALGLAAASQGTMNNLLFGDSTFGYYETICGGAGATRSAPGASAVHTHMTNTRLTDPEVLEQRFPVRVREFAVRRGSGGMGRHRGGDGVVRRLEFLRPLVVSILSQRRTCQPFGLEGGAPGAAGQNTLLNASGNLIDLGGCAQFQVEPGDLLTIATPGGGGWGKP